MKKELFTCLCKERKGEIRRTVYEVDFDIETLKRMWDKQYPRYKTLMGREVSTFEEFVGFFVRERIDGTLESKGICYAIDDIGIFWLSDIHYPAYAEVHYTFWDGKLEGRLEICKKAIKYAFSYYGLNLLYVQIAGYAGKHMGFAETLGFRKEGVLRSRVKKGEAWWDLTCYSLLKHETSEWSIPE